MALRGYLAGVKSNAPALHWLKNALPHVATSSASKAKNIFSYKTIIMRSHDCVKLDTAQKIELRDDHGNVNFTQSDMSQLRRSKQSPTRSQPKKYMQTIVVANAEA